MDAITIDKAIEIAGFLTGLLYLYWEYKANRLLWVAGLLMPCMSMWVYWHAGLYADFGMNIYYLLMAVYGLLAWGRRDESGRHPALKITHIPRGRLVAAGVLFVPVYLLLAWVLIRFTNSTVPWLDSLTTALSMVGTWMLARKYIEQWLVWIAVDIVSFGLYFYKGIPLYGALYFVYTVIAFFGMAKWRRLMHKQHAATLPSSCMR